MNDPQYGYGYAAQSRKGRAARGDAQTTPTITVEGGEEDGACAATDEGAGGAAEDDDVAEVALPAEVTPTVQVSLI